MFEKEPLSAGTMPTYSTVRHCWTCLNDMAGRRHELLLRPFKAGGICYLHRISLQYSEEIFR